MIEVLEFSRAPSVARTAVRGSLHRRPRGTAVLPPRVAVVPALGQDLDQLARYNRLCGFTLRDAVPSTWLHVLTFGLQTALMAQADFPFPVIGLVHTANTMTLHRPVHHTEALRVEVRAGQLRPHRRGATFAIVGEMSCGSEVVWTGVSTYLARGRTAREPSADGTTGVGEGIQLDDPTPTHRAQTWRLPADLGRRYAAVSGDVNPIHLHPLAARAFGFRSAIMHGMWTLARSLAALEGRAGPAHRLDARFTSPVPLPSTVHFAARSQAQDIRFAVLGADPGGPRPGRSPARGQSAVHLEGRLVRL